MVLMGDSIPIIVSAVVLVVIWWRSYKDGFGLALELDDDTGDGFVTGETEDDFAAEEVEIGVELMGVVQVNPDRHDEQY
jgi:hypothetical protein